MTASSTKVLVKGINDMMGCIPYERCKQLKAEYPKAAMMTGLVTDGLVSINDSGKEYIETYYDAVKAVYNEVRNS